MSSVLFGDCVKQDVSVSSWPALTQPMQITNFPISLNGLQVHFSIESYDCIDTAIYSNMAKISIFKNKNGYTLSIGVQVAFPFDIITLMLLELNTQRSTSFL